MTLELVKVADGETLILYFEGRIERADLPALEAALLEEVNSGSRSLLIDLSGVEHLSSGGLEKLVAAGKRLKGYAGHFAVSGPFLPEVRDIFERADLSRHMRIVSTRPQGIQWLSERRTFLAKARLARKLLPENDVLATRRRPRSRRELVRMCRLAARILDVSR